MSEKSVIPEMSEMSVMSEMSEMSEMSKMSEMSEMSEMSVMSEMSEMSVLKRVQSTGKKAEFWHYVPYNLVAYPYVAQAYDKRRLPVVKNVTQALSVAEAARAGG
ncbi:Heavy metal-associated isoprenylated plant protein 21, partial [Cucurbita argyrosperma subsp. sororia]